MAVVMIGVDPHKASHTAVAISAAEEPLGQLRVRASAVQAERLLGWAQAWPQRTWAVEGAGGVGHLLARQLAAAGERVLDVPPTPAAFPPGTGRQAPAIRPAALHLSRSPPQCASSYAGRSRSSPPPSRTSSSLSLTWGNDRGGHA